jgi:hypothetical protein
MSEAKSCSSDEASRSATVIMFLFLPLQVMGALVYSFALQVPIIMTYHTHLPVYIPKYKIMGWPSNWLVNPAYLYISESPLLCKLAYDINMVLQMIVCFTVTQGSHRARHLEVKQD